MKNRTHCKLSYNVIFLLLFFSCATTTPFLNEEKETGITVIPAEHLVFIGLDGWGGKYLPKANMPSVKQMIGNGSSSMDITNVLPSVSWPNWTSLFRGTTPDKQTVDGFPSIFTIARNKNPGKNIALFYEWGELSKICSSKEAELFRIESNHESALKAAAYITEKKPLFTAVVFDEPDHAGHTKNWGSKAYYEKLAELDGYIAIIRQAVIDAGIYDKTVFVLASDHGGFFKGHHHNVSKNRKIPLVIYGKGIKKGYTISSPAGICDIAPTMALILGLEIPSEWTGSALLEVFK